MRTFETREAYPQSNLFSSEKTFERLAQSISKGLNGGRRNMFTATTFKPCRQIILARECPLFHILLLDRLKHLIIDDARLTQALHEQMGLFLLHVKAIFKRFHASNYIRLEAQDQQEGTHNSSHV